MRGPSDRMGSLPTAVSLLLNRLRTDFVRGEDFGIKNFLDTGLHLALLFRSSLLNRFFTPKVAFQPPQLGVFGNGDLYGTKTKEFKLGRAAISAGVREISRERLRVT